MNMTSRIINDCNAVSNGLRTTIYAERDRLPAYLQRRLDAFVVILEQLKEDVTKNDAEFQDQLMKILRPQQ